MNEDAANRIVDHYERHALSWDADRRAAGWIDKPFIERFLNFLPQGATVLDLGCGGGSPIALHMVAGLSRHRSGRFPDAHLAMPSHDAGSGVGIGFGMIEKLALLKKPWRTPAAPERLPVKACVKHLFTICGPRLL